MQVALFSYDQYWDGYGSAYCGSYEALQNVTEWDEVTEKDYKLLQAWCSNKSKNSAIKYIVIVREKDIPKKISEYIQIAKDEEAKAEERKRKAAERRSAAARKKAAKDLEDKKKLLLELKKELGEK